MGYFVRRGFWRNRTGFSRCFGERGGSTDDSSLLFFLASTFNLPAFVLWDALGPLVGDTIALSPCTSLAVLNTPAYAFIGYVIGIDYRRRQASRRLRCGRCVNCDYDLTGNLSGTCPECRTQTPARILELIQRDRLDKEMATRERD